MINEVTLIQKAYKEGVTHFTTGVAVFMDDKLLVVRREAHDADLGGAWELPGGGVDDGETIQQGAIRELKEETNLDVDEILGTFEGFDYATSRKPKARQFNFKVSVKLGEIILTEHDMFKWITESDIAELNTNFVMQECLKRAFRS